MGKLTSKSPRPTSSAVQQGPKGKKGKAASSKTVLDRILDSTAKISPFNREGREKAVDAVATPATESSQTNVSFNPQGEKTMILNYDRTKKNVVLYKGEGLKGSVRFLTSQFASEPPESIEVASDGFASPAAPKVKETKEERKARLAAMTPEQKTAAAKETARKRLAAATKRAAALGVA